MRIAAIDAVTERRYPLPRLVFQPDGPHRLAIDLGHLLARAQVADRGVAFRRGDAKRDAAAIAAAVEAEHEAGLLRRAAMHERIHAQRPVRADQPRRNALDKRETRTPHQRAVTEHPEVFDRGSENRKHATN